MSQFVTGVTTLRVSILPTLTISVSFPRYTTRYTCYTRNKSGGLYL